MLEKKAATQPKSSAQSDKSWGKRRLGSAVAVDDEPKVKRRRQSWLGEEVASSVRRMRTSFFTCSLAPASTMTDLDEKKVGDYDTFISDFENKSDPLFSSGIADARHALLEFSQFRNLEFDTLRHAKHSTAVMLYHLHNDDAPGMVPQCSSCSFEIKDVRWHKLGRVFERRRATRFAPPASVKRATATSFQPEELCATRNLINLFHFKFLFEARGLSHFITHVKP